MIKRVVIGAVALSIPLGLAVTAIPASAVVTTPTPTVVNEQDVNAASPHWFFDNTTNAPTNGVGSFVNGPATPPYGTGSLQLQTPTSTDKIGLYTDLYQGDPLSELADAYYSTYLQSGTDTTTPTTVMPTVQVQITGANKPDLSGTVGFDTLVFEPIYCYGNGAPAMDTWQTWDANNPPAQGSNGGCWWSTHAIAGAPDQSTYTSLAAIQAANPNATLLGVGVNLGSDGTTKANVDGLGLNFSAPGCASVNISNCSITNPPVVPANALYDFEHYTPPAPVASVNDVSMNEGNSGTHNMKFTVTLTGDLSQPHVVGYTTADGTATATGGGAGNPDYTSKSGVLEFAANQSTAFVNVPIRGDKVTEANETFTLDLLPGGSTATIGDGSGTGTILNDDAKPSMKISDASVAEGNSGTKPMTFHVSLNHASAFPVTVHYTTVDGTAKAGSDYVAATGSVTFAPGQLNRPITIQIKGDKTKEKNESFIVTLYNPGNGSISDPNGSGVIRNDD